MCKYYGVKSTKWNVLLHVNYRQIAHILVTYLVTLNTVIMFSGHFRNEETIILWDSQII